MIASLRGKIIRRGINRVVLETGGVGYDVAVSLSTLESLPQDGEVFLHVHTVMRENSLDLFGFMTRDEKALFELLLGVSGVGPRTALVILSGSAPAGFQQAVIENDVRMLTTIPGVGKKLAERIIVELRDKVRKSFRPDEAQAIPSAMSSMLEDLISSLVNLGYKEKHAAEAARKVLAASPADISVTQALRLALKELMV